MAYGKRLSRSQCLPSTPPLLKSLLQSRSVLFKAMPFHFSIHKKHFFYPNATVWFIYSIVMHGICVYLPNVVADNWIHYTLLDRLANVSRRCCLSCGCWCLWWFHWLYNIVLHCLVIVSLNGMGWAGCLCECVFVVPSEAIPSQRVTSIWCIRSLPVRWLLADVVSATLLVVSSPGEWGISPPRLITNRKHFNKSVQPLGSRWKSDFSPSDRLMSSMERRYATSRNKQNRKHNLNENIMFT